MARLSGGEALVKSLVREGVEVVFGLPGVQMYGIIAALRDEPGIRLITTRHEQATTYMADGYARASGRPGVAMVVPGPGVFNAGSGLATAFATSSPVLLIAGQIPRAGIGKDLGGLHEVNDQMQVVAPVVKWQKRVLSARDVPAGITQAFAALRTGRPRPVEFELPPEAMVERDEMELEEPIQVKRVIPGRDQLEQAAAAIAAAKRPVIYAGGGVARSDAEEELVEFAEGANIPVILSAAGKGAISDRHPLCLGASLGPTGTLKEIMESADVVVAVGTRFSLRNPAGESARLIHIDIDPGVVGQIHPDTLGLVGDAKATLLALLEAVRGLGANGRPSANAMVAEARRRIAESQCERNEPQHSILMAIREGVPENGLTVWGMTQLGYYSRPHWDTFRPKSYFDSGYSGNLGYSFPTALGVKVARPDEPVVCIVGDGGFMYNSSELSTAAKYNISLVTVVFNDGHFGNVARDLDQDFGGSYEADFVNPDFMKLADAYGVAGMRTRDPLEVGDKIAEALAMNRPVLIEVPVDRMPRPKIWSARAPWTLPQEGLIDQ